MSISSLARGIVVFASATLVVIPALAKDPGSRRKSDDDRLEIELFEGMKSGQLEVRYIPADSSRGKVVVKNKTGKPVRVKLPAAFAGVPVHRQGLGGLGGGGLGGGLGGGGLGGGGFGGGGGQGVGGGFGGGGLGGGGMGGFGGGGMGGFGGGGFGNIDADKVRRFKVRTVCLEHGKKDPTPRMEYTIVPIESFTKNPEVAELCKLVGSGRIDSAAAQAAAWHLANGMSWQELANKVGKVHLNGSREPYFTRPQIAVGMKLVSLCRQRVAYIKERRKQEPTESGPSTEEVLYRRAQKRS